MIWLSTRFISAHHITADLSAMSSGETPESGRADRDKLILAVIVAAIVLASGSSAYVWYSSAQSGGGEVLSIRAGDEVSLHYIGRLPDGRVFDTSLWYVAQDDAKYPKSLTFTHRSNESYMPLAMTAGDYGPKGTIKGFALGVIGMHVGDTRIIDVPVGEGYALRPDRISTIPLIDDTIPVTEVMTEEDFKIYYKVNPVPMDTLLHYFWGWDVVVVSISGGYVTVRSQPYVGETVYPYGNPNLLTDPSGWEVRVIGYDPAADGGRGKITVQHMVRPEDVYYVKGKDVSGEAVIVWDYDADNGTFQIHRSLKSIGYNAEISGRELFFEVTILSIAPAE